MKKLVYVAHPLRGDVPGNMERIEEIMRELSEEHLDCNFFSPLHGFSFHTPAEDQALVMERCLDMLDRCDELWVFGDWSDSEGCRREIRHAACRGMTILFSAGDSSKALWCALTRTTFEQAPSEEEAAS
jgi:hypothetical protein